MSWFFRALFGYVIGSFFHMPFYGLLAGLFWNSGRSGSQQFFQQNTHSWNFNAFIRENYQEGRWVQGCFSSLGALAKAGETVTKKDIAFAEALMIRWGYTASHREQAINAFRYGRQCEPHETLRLLSQSYYWTHSPQGSRLIAILQEYARQKALTTQQKYWLQQWAQVLGSTQGYQHYESFHRTHQRTHQQSAYQSTDSEDLAWAYKTLEASPQDDAATVKKKFRKLIARVHPDRNANDPQATEKTQKIQKAYALLKESKGWK